MEYSLVTKDNEVTDINLVQAREGKRTTDPILTLQYLNTQLNEYNARLAELQVKIPDIQSKIDAVTALAKTVVLIVPKPPMPVVELSEKEKI